MLKLRIKYIILFIAIASTALAQEHETEYAIEIDTATHNKWAPTGVRIGVDIAGPIYNLWEPTISNYEGMVDIDFNKFFAVIELGNGAYQSTNTPTSYTSNGTFFRIGADVNMTPKDSKLNILFFGIRYSTSSFNESLRGKIKNSGWGLNAIDAEQSKSRANWVELNIGMRVRVVNSFYTGYALRFKLLKHNTFSQNEFETYFIPGYGLAENTSNWGVSYYVQYRFEWKKKPIPWKLN